MSDLDDEIAELIKSQESNLPVEFDLLSREPNTYPAHFPRPGYCVEYTFGSNQAEISVYWFSSSTITSPGLENIEFSSLHRLMKIRVDMSKGIHVMGEGYPLEGSLLTYYLEVAAELVGKLLVLAGADVETCEDAINQLVTCNQNYLYSLN